MSISNSDFPGKGRKRPQLNVVEENLLLDPQNPRLPADIQGSSQEDIIYTLYQYFDIDELAFSMSENGYFDEEPLVAIPNNLPEKFSNREPLDLENDKEYFEYINHSDTKFVVVEGNRRLSTIKVLLHRNLQASLKIRGLPLIRDEIAYDLSILPVIIYPTRKSVLPYLGVRHISGVKKWEPYAKARYIAYMIEDGRTIDEVQKIVADRSNSARKFYLCYKLLEQVRDAFDYDTSTSESEFSYLLLASGQGSIKEFIGLPTNLSNVDYDRPVPADKEENLHLLFSWLYGEGTKVPRAVRESRDITNLLSPVIKSEASLNYLKTTRNLIDAYDRSGGEEKLVLDYIKKANANLEKSLQGLHRQKGSEPISVEIKRCEENLKVVNQIFHS